MEFNREGVRDDMPEYSWSVSIDVDNDCETGGPLGDEYSMSASPFGHPSFSDAGVHLPIEEAVQVDTWRMDPHGLGRASIDVSSEENTITHVGEIPGISSESRLEYEAYDFLHGYERVTCRVPVDGT